MAYTLGTVSAIASSTGTSSYSANLPAGVSTGQLLLLAAATRVVGTTTISTPAGFTLLASYGAGGLSLFAKIAGPSESAPTIALSGNDTSEASMCTFNGAPGSISGIIDGSPTVVETAIPSANLIPHGALTVAQNNDLILEVVMQRGVQWGSMGLLAGFSLIQDDPIALGGTMSMGWQYQVQGAAANIASGNVSITGGSGNTCVSILVALQAGVIGGAGQPQLLTLGVG